MVLWLSGLRGGGSSIAFEQFVPTNFQTLSRSEEERIHILIQRMVSAYCALHTPSKGNKFLNCPSSDL